MEGNEQHQITVENKKRVVATLIDSVDRFSPSQLIISYAGGRIEICGTDLKITSFSRSGGTFTATGNVGSVRYLQKGTGLRQKLFK